MSSHRPVPSTLGSGAAQAAWLQRVERSFLTGRLAPLRYESQPFCAKLDGNLLPAAGRSILVPDG